MTDKTDQKAEAVQKAERIYSAFKPGQAAILLDLFGLIAPLTSVDEDEGEGEEE